MNKLSLVLCLSIVGCSSDDTIAPPPAAPINWTVRAVESADAGPLRATDKERAVAIAYEKALESPAFSGLKAVLDEDARMTYGADKKSLGRDRVIASYDKLFGAFDERDFIVSRVWLTDRSQAIEWTMKGSQARPWLGLAPSHKPVVIKGLTLMWTNDDGSVTDTHVYFDEAIVRAQLGAGPKELMTLPLPPVPQGAREDFEQTRAPAETDDVLVFRKSLDALEEAKEDAYLDTMTDDFELTTLEQPPARGKDKARAFYRLIRKELGQLDTTIESAWGVGSFAIVQYSISGEQLKPIGVIPFVRDRGIRLLVVDIAEFRDGHIARITRYDNQGAIASEESEH